ncbi:MAG: flagellar hook-length control protein FliK [Magnetospirillum sp.]|nr:flagellar hook-length control protein FliK [Magnetospirillum sp.]
MDQVKVQIAKAGANGDTIKVQLKPVELGSIEVKLDVAKDGSVSGVVTADNKDTLAMLKNDSRTLEKALSDAGFKTDAGSLTFNLRGEGQSQNAQDQGTGTRRRRSVLGAANGIDATQAGMAAQAQARLGGGRAGVDIQV